jgi:hypothetical protein
MVKIEIASPLSGLAMTEKPNKISHCERPRRGGRAWQSQKQIITQPPRGGGFLLYAKSSIPEIYDFNKCEFQAL